jgi:adenylate kinase family enzyme
VEFPQPGQRITIRGLSGSGKTTLGDQLEEILNIPHTEMDELFWKANWEQSTDEEFFPQISAIASQDKWILCGNYSRSRHLIDPRADTIIWLDYPFPFVMFRLLRRCIVRGTRKDILWGHCQESIRTAFIGKDAIIWFTIRNRHRLSQKLKPIFANPEPSKIYLRFTNPKQTNHWLNELSVFQKGKIES